MTKESLPAQSVTVMAGSMLYVCPCCHTHGDRPLVWGEPTTCVTCGHLCSCEGCHADVEAVES